MQQPRHFSRKNEQIIFGFDYVHLYLDNLLVITKGSFDGHLSHLDRVLEKLEKTGLKINATKSCFAAHKLEYLDYWISRDGTQPMAAKVDAIKICPNQKIERPCKFSLTS